MEVKRSKPAVVRVLVVDDDAAVRDSITVVLATDAQVEVVGEAADGREAVDLVDRHRPDVVLMDVRMPRTDGLQAIEEIRRRHTDQRIVVLTTFGEADYVRRAVALGVNGFLLKAGDPYELLRGVHAVQAGGACLAPSVAAVVVGDARAASTGDPDARGARRALERLPQRERDVLALVGQGRSNTEIAEALHLSEGTVKGYLSSVFGRLGVRNRVEAALVAWRAR